MFHRYFPCKRFIMVLCLLALTCGCAGKAVMESGRPPDALERIPRAIQKTDRIVATAQIELTTAEGRYPVRAALILQRPSYLRLEMLPVIGTPDLFLTATPDEMRIFIPSRGEFYTGKPSAENVARFLPWALNVEDIVMILSGAYPVPAGENISCERFAEGRLLRTDMKNPSGFLQKVWAMQNGSVTKFIRYGPDGKETYQVQYEDYAPSSPLAETINIQWADNKMSVCIKYSDWKVEKATDGSVFELPVPAGMKSRRLD